VRDRDYGGAGEDDFYERCQLRLVVLVSRAQYCRQVFYTLLGETRDGRETLSRTVRCYHR
jgi:hypothetical protein